MIWSCEHGIETSGSTKYVKFLE